MIHSLRKFFKEGGWLLLLMAVLCLGGWHTDVVGFLQRGLLYTGFFTPSEDEDEPDAPQLIDVQTILLYDEQGNSLQVKQLHGELLLLNVWATWCAPCVAEMPGLNALYEEVGEQNVRFLMISVDNEFEKAIAFRDKKGYTFPLYRLGSLPDELRSRTIPSTYVIGKEGQLLFKHQGMARYDSPAFKEMLQNWLKTDPSPAAQKL